MVERDEKGLFLPGVSGNPGGRPKTRKVTEALRKLLEMSAEDRAKYKPANGYEEIAIGLIESATAGDGKFRQKTHAQALIYDRIEGKADISDSELEAAKANRTILWDMPMPAVAPKELSVTENGVAIKPAG